MASLFEVTAGAAIGYVSGGAVTQATNKSTGVTLNTASGRITMNGAALARCIQTLTSPSQTASLLLLML
jgi:hypothetical protein